MRIITANWIYTPEGLFTQHVLEVQNEGAKVRIRKQRPEDRPDFYQGVLCPGFVNAHCHLELSAFQGRIPPHTGMVSFIQSIIRERFQLSPTQHQEAIKASMKAIWDTGTVAVGDICNTLDSLSAKREFPQLYVHNFIELLGLRGEQSDEIVERGFKLAQAFDGLPHSLTPHAPYSVSPQLRDRIYALLTQSQGLASIHLLESPAERELFDHKRGPFLDFWASIGLGEMQAPSQDAANYILQGMPSQQKGMLVHLTQATQQELQTLAQQYPHLFFCLCPRSNEYIHNQYPDIQRFLPFADRICLGTDSFASNYSLDIFDDLKLLHKQYPNLPLHTLLKWATTNGAQALQQSQNFGSFGTEGYCGINWIYLPNPQHKILSEDTPLEKLY